MREDEMQGGGRRKWEEEGVGNVKRREEEK